MNDLGSWDPGINDHSSLGSKKIGAGSMYFPIENLVDVPASGMLVDPRINSPENERMSRENQWLVQMDSLLKVRPFLGDIRSFSGVYPIFFCTFFFGFMK